jgi:hypothetical protein
LRARYGERRGDASINEHLPNVRLPSPIYVVDDSRGLRVLISPTSHADFKEAAVPESAAQQDIQALLGRFILREICDNRFSRRLSPMRNHLGMKGAEFAEVPVEAATRDAELARKDICLQGLETLADERFQSEINPVLGC